MGVKKVHGVNFFDETHYKHSHAYIDSDEYLDGPCSHTVITHQGQVYKCDSILVVSFPEINKFYCKYHKYCGIKEVAKNKKIKDALELKKLAAEAKQKIAQEKAAQKESVKLAKLAIKAAKDEAKLANKLTKNNNEVSDNNNTNSILTQPDNNKCIQTLKTGANKGEQCGCKIFQNNLCTRHYNLNTKVYTV
jgi:ATPase subunit of ABC transporter with duplicated ATPase domains